VARIRRCAEGWASTAPENPPAPPQDPHRTRRPALGKEEPDGLPSPELQALCDDLLEAGIPAELKDAGTSLAVDWSDLETFSRPPPHGTADCADPEASWGHRRNNLLHGEDELFFGYYLSDAVTVPDGSRHDNYCQQESGVLLAMNTKNWIGDKGYVGNNMITPYRKPAGGELLDWQKEYNAAVNKIRWMIEQVISHFKNWAIMHTDYRRPLKTFETTISAVVGLHFYRTA
jgi:hypothetical protein